jgi:putative transposase
MSLQGSHLGVEQMCALGRVSRAGYYRNLQIQAPKEEETAIRGEIQKIAVAHKRRYGVRRVAKQLRDQGMIVNRKRVARIMREDNLLAIRYRKFVPTTDSSHRHKVYWNLAKRMTLTGINQLWVADITYIRLREEFVYLAVVLDAYSRKVIGWALERNMQVHLTVSALRQALEQRRPPANVVHHSDQGSQYACPEYVQILLENEMIPSMSRAGCPYDNAACESFMKTLKQEEIYASEYRNLEDLRTHLQEFLNDYYNRVRLHSALGYRSPDAFEATLPVDRHAQAATFEFSEALEIYRSDMGVKSNE